jgi:hypothetical protein
VPDLSQPAVLGWLAARDPAALPVAEPGSVDGDPEALRLLAVLGHALDRAPPAVLADPGAAARMARLMGALGTARRLLLLEHLGPEGAEALFAAPDGAFLRAEVAALARRGVAARVLSTERAASLAATLGNGDSES